MTDTPNEPVEGAESIDQCGASEVDTYTGTYTIRDVIADRTGELIDKAFHHAAQHMRVDIGGIIDPRDGTMANVMVGRDGMTLISPSHFDAYRDKPLRVEGVTDMTRIDSLIAMGARFGTEHSAIFAEEALRPSLNVIFDYHPAGGKEPEWCSHRARYEFPFSPEWEAWTGRNGQRMSMFDFAAFLEDHIVDVLAEPGELDEHAAALVALNKGTFATPSKLIEISRGLQVHENSVIKEVRNLSTGEGEFTFDTQHVDADGAPLKIPNMFVIAIPVFKRSTDAYRMLARLRYRKAGASLTFWYELLRADEVFNTAFEEVVNHVASELGMPVFYGTPQG